MIHLYTSHSLTILADALAGHIAVTEFDDPLQSLTVMVPNRDTARWLTLHLAKTSGLAANIRYLLPSEWMWKVIRKKFPNLPDHLASDPDAIKWALADEFLKEEGSAIHPIEGYLSTQPEDQREKAAIKLAESIASVFDAYLFYRPEMITSWQENRSQEGDAAWQARLWRKLSDRWQDLHGGLPYSHNKAELFQQVMESEDPLIQNEDPIWVFNPGLIPGPVVRMLKKWGEGCPVQIYQLQPSATMETNENPLAASFGKEAVRVHALFQEIADQTHPLFEPFPEGAGSEKTESKDGDQTRLLFDPHAGDAGSEKAESKDGDQADTLFEPLSEENTAHLKSPPDISRLAPLPKVDTLLGAIQSDIITNKTPSARENLKGCSSVQIRSCHSPLRETEALHDFLLSRFEEDGTLNPEDVLVVTPDPELYIPYVRAVFNVKDGNLPRIPVHIGNPGSAGAGERAFTDLLEITGSGFEKEEVLNLIRSEAIRAAFHLNESDCDLIEQWTEDNNVLWGLDYGDGLPAGSPHNNSWDTMMERGWMGQLLGDSDPLQGGPLVYEGVRDRGRQETWASLAAFLRKMHTFRSGTKEKRRIRQWCGWIRHQIGDLFGSDFMMARESESIIRAINDLAEYSELSGSRSAFSFDQFRAELTARLQNSGAAGARFTRGVIFSSMVPVRGLPFRIIALVGLNDLSFPRRTGTPDFDLMAQDPQPGERNRKEEDRNLFLQSVLSASDFHYSSYIGQSKVDNEEIPPSVVLQQWVDYLSEVTYTSGNQIIAKEPITGFSEKKYKSGFRVMSDIYEQAAVQIRKSDGKLFGLTGEGLSDEEYPGAAIHIQELLSFVKNPSAYFFQNRFQVRMSDFYHEKKEFSFSGLSHHLLCKQVLKWKLNGAEDQQIAGLLRDSGSVPFGWPGERAINEMLGSVGRALQMIEKNGWTAGQGEYLIEAAAGESVIKGRIESDAANVLLDIYPASFSGKNVLQSWVKYLAYGCTSGQWNTAFVLTDLKKDRTELYTFRKPEKPARLLQDLVALYRMGRSNPKLWMSGTVTEYLMNDEEKRDAKAKGEFEGDSNRFGERDHEEVQLLLGSDAVYTKELVTGNFANWTAEMVKNMEKKG